MSYQSLLGIFTCDRCGATNPVRSMRDFRQRQPPGSDGWITDYETPRKDYCGRCNAIRGIWGGAKVEAGGQATP